MIGDAVKRPEPEVYAELRAGLVPGVIVVPAHTMLLGLCQERGCSYEVTLRRNVNEIPACRCPDDGFRRAAGRRKLPRRPVRRAADRRGGALDAARLSGPDATVLGYGADGKLAVIRKGTGSMICLASDPKAEQFHVSCYHNSMEPFMARGRELRASGVTGGQVDTVRFQGGEGGQAARCPRRPPALYQLFGGAFDPAKNEVTGARALYVVYIPFATGATHRTGREAHRHAAVDHVAGHAQGAHHVHAVRCDSVRTGRAQLTVISDDTTESPPELNLRV